MQNIRKISTNFSASAKNDIPKFLGLIFLFLLSTEASQAASTLNSGDLLVGFNSPSGLVQTSQDYLLNLGPASAFYTDTTTILTLGNYGADLNSIFGNGWYNNTGVSWGAIAGITTGSGPSTKSTIYASAPTTGVGVAVTGYTPQSGVAMKIPIQTSISTFYGPSGTGAVFSGGSSSKLASNACLSPSSPPSPNVSWSLAADSITPFSYFSRSILANFSNSSATSAVLDLFRIYSGNSSSDNLGYLQIDNSGTLTFTPYAVALTNSGGGGSNGGGGPAYEGPWIWTGASGAWSDTNNWLSNSYATNGLPVGITGSGGTITNDTVSSLGTLTYSNGTGSYTVTGTNPVQSIGLSGGIINNSTNTQTITLGLSTATNQTLNAASGNLILSGGISNSAVLTMLEGTNKSTLASILVSGAITGTGSLVQGNTGTLILGASNSYTGGTTVAAGTLVASNASALGNPSNSLSVKGTLNLGSQSITQGAVSVVGGAILNGTLSSTSVNLQGASVSASLSGPASVQSSGSTKLLGSNNFSGGLSVNGGTLVASNAFALAGGAVSVNSGTLNLTGISQSAGAVTLGNAVISGSGVLSLSSLTATNSGAALVSESLSSPGSFSQNGPGVTTLSGTNSFAGGITVNSGSVVIAPGGKLGGAVNVATSGASLVLNSGASLSGTNRDMVSGLLLDQSGLAFTNAIKGQLVLLPTGQLQKTYSNGASVAGFAASIGTNGKAFSILAGVAPGTNGSATLSASLTNGGSALNFSGTYTNAAVLQLIDPSYTTNNHTILWYNTNTSKWTNTISGNGQAISGTKVKAPANVSTATIRALLGKNAALYGSTGFKGSFNTFLIDIASFHLTNGVASLNALSSSLITADLNKIMGANGFDSLTSASWAVIDHNSIFSSTAGSFNNPKPALIQHPAKVSKTISNVRISPASPIIRNATTASIPLIRDAETPVSSKVSALINADSGDAEEMSDRETMELLLDGFEE